MTKLLSSHSKLHGTMPQTREVQGVRGNKVMKESLVSLQQS